MELKDYQRRVVEKLDSYLSTLRIKQADCVKAIAALQAAGVESAPEYSDFPKKAWDDLRAKGLLPRAHAVNGSIIPDHVARYDSGQRPIPHICLKVPTGGGKTLIGAEGVGHIQTAFLRRQTGLILWVMPTTAIYTQTKKALTNREHSYRQTLERASAGRVKILEKDDPFTKADIENYLCIMLIRLAAATRQTDTEFLRIFRDTGRYTSFFPEVDDYSANNALLTFYPDLESNDLADGGSPLKGLLVKQSLVNVLRMQRPVVVIDEGQKAYSDNTRLRLNSFNPSFILELTATPNAKHHLSNVLVDVSGLDLKNEQMIKLPITISNIRNGDWKNTLTQAWKRLESLQADASTLQNKDGIYIRPIMLIRAERVGADQRDGKKIHSDDAKEFLINQLGIDRKQIRIKTAEKDELGDEDLLDPVCPVRFIITKSALQEGWDCPFAYVLTLLDKTTASTALTQMVGRILRQPYTRTMSVPSLNESYVFCFDQKVDEAVNNVKAGLEAEGMTGLGEFVQADGANAKNGNEPEIVAVRRDKKFSGLQIFLPQVLHKDGKKWRRLNYERDILAEIDWDALGFTDEFLASGIDGATIDVRQVDMRQNQGQLRLDFNSMPDTGNVWIEMKLDISFFARQLLDVIPNPWQASRITLDVLERLQKNGKTVEQLFDSRVSLADTIKTSLKATLNAASETIFKQKLKEGQITFRLVTTGDDNLNFAIAKELHLATQKDEKKFTGADGLLPSNTLFEFAYARTFNNLEKDFAVYLSGDETVTWWHRMVARQDYSLQGWQRNKIYPDFVACIDGKRLLVLETKGLQLKGNDDTEYKAKLFEILTNFHHNAIRAGEIDLSDGHSQPMRLKMLMETDWQQSFEVAKQDT